ncbi:hypothetical protein H0A36_13915 [Endozoicomonas sp. SM1973]|uniref:DUF1990 domain-containing protein n=1 Tax=Spartinivicinus marinus TaxID=2994442 RepID=A0A853I670_9GAMM|nr:hypothetical protein [Spartinivicinus marinus]MCX4028622.1 hypothetical protein [Spartinivicinus marinus]NYZ67112.1 hypothetical protein [Spartinivicinus marinus]
MKYFETSYIVNKPISLTFDSALDILSLHTKVGLFDKAYVTTNELGVEDIGKIYSVVTNYGDISVRCLLKLEKIKKPYLYILNYSYETKNEEGKINEGCSFIPWETLTCVVSFVECESGTRITTTVYANGVRSLFGKLSTKVLGLVNSFQQRKYNKRTAAYINEKMT